MWIYDSYTIKFVYSSDFHLYRAYTHRKSVWEVYRIQNSIINNTFFIRSHISPQTVYTLSVRVSLTLHRKLNSIWGASNQMKFKLKVTIKLSECRDHWGSPLPLSSPLPPSSTPCSFNLSDVGVALGMQIMSNVTSNFRQDAQLQRGAWFRFYLGHKNFLESGEDREGGGVERV